MTSTPVLPPITTVRENRPPTRVEENPPPTRVEADPPSTRVEEDPLPTRVGEDPPSTHSSGENMSREKSMPDEIDLEKKDTGFMGLFKNNQITLRNLLLSGATVGSEVLVSTEVFDCPANGHKAYGTAFLVAPAVIIFFTSLVALGELPMLTDRCCVSRYRQVCGCSGRVVSGIFKACFPAFFWLIASFLDTTYYVCREVGQAIEKRNLTDETEIKMLQEKFAKAKSDSQVWAWVLFTILISLTAIVIMITKWVLQDRSSLERREAVAALFAFDKGTRHLVEEKPEIKSRTSHLLEKYKGTMLYPYGVPEELGQGKVQKLLKNESNESYLKAYEIFADMYPRVTSGKPWDDWVKQEN